LVFLLQTHRPERGLLQNEATFSISIRRKSSCMCFYPSVSANFRPISNLNNISKILEKLFLTRLQPHIALSPNFNPLQSAYSKHHFTDTSLIHLLDSIYYAADNGLATLLLSLLILVLPFIPLTMLFFSIVSLLVLAQVLSV